MSEVYFASSRAERLEDSLVFRLRRLIERSGVLDFIRQGEIIAVKLHVGEHGNWRHIRPHFVRVVIEEIRRRGGKPFLTDTVTLYRGRRADAVNHAELAIEHGFSYCTVRAVFIPADGIRGEYGLKVKVDGIVLKEVEVAGILQEIDGLVVLSHVKGHGLAGWGGALKNLAMGLVTRRMKVVLHMHGKPYVREDRCIGCGTCARHCPRGAISIEFGKAKIDEEKCVGCGECILVCPNRAIEYDLAHGEELQRKMADAAAAVIRVVGRENIGYLNFVLDVTPHCDCWGAPDNPLIPDQGVLASTDPVAIDQASLDLIERAPVAPLSALEGRTSSEKLKELHGVDPRIILEAAEKLGLGSRRYRLIEVQ